MSRACCRISDGGGLVDHGAPLAPLAAPVAQHSLRRDGGEPLVAQPHRDRRDPPGQPAGEDPRPWPPPGPRRPTASGAGRRRPPPPPPRRRSRRAGRGRPVPRLHRLHAGWRGSRTGRCARPRSGRRRGRAEPYAVAHRPQAPAARATSVGHQRQRLVDPGGVGAAALRDVGLAAALAADQRADGADQVVGADAAGARLVVDRGDHGDLRPAPAPRCRSRRPPRPPCGQPAADVERERAHVAARRAVDAVGDDADAVHVLRTGRELRRRRPAAAGRATFSISFSAARSRSTRSATRPTQVVGLGLEQAGQLARRRRARGRGRRSPRRR